MEKWLKLFGLQEFRSGQRAVIEAIMNGQDTLVVMPTGGGKSLCYQLPAVSREGVTIVVSPLIALMKDQVDALTSIDIPATCINSSMTAGEQHERMDRMVSGEFKLVYIAPERLRHAGFLKALARVDVKLLAIDEAHCISQWGHDFRPDYARLGKFRERIGDPQTVALTATATSTVREDIQNILALKSPEVFITGFSRDNLSLRVESPKSNSEKDARVVELLESRPGAGIIYASSRKSCEHLVELLSTKTSFPIEYYHAGLSHADRHRVQENFMSGKTPVVVATNAFGMGIDKADLRFVLHYNIPGSLEAYYQEAGRAGRDGKLSVCLLLYSYQDRFIQEFFIENSFPSRETVREVYEFLQSFEDDPIEITLQELKEQLNLPIGTEGIANCEHLLEKAGAIERLDSQQNMAAIRIDSNLPTLVELLPREAKNPRRVMRALENVVGALRGERVLFSPRRLSDVLDLKWESISRAIRQLTELPFVDYVPPFRGRAIHMIDRKRPFSQIEIDFAELERRKKAEYERLDKVVGFATSYRCRQLEILEYFGDPERKNCHRCDRCGTPWPDLAVDLKPISLQKHLVDKKVGEVSGALLYATQVALSGVWRTKGRIGKGLVAKMLFGSDSKAVKSQGLQRLSTFGLLKPLRQSEIENLIGLLVSSGFITQEESARFRPVVQLSEAGQKLMLGRLNVDLLNILGESFSKRLQTVFAGKKPKLGDADEKTESVAVQVERPIAKLVDTAVNPTATVQMESHFPNKTNEDMSPITNRTDAAVPHSTVKAGYYWTWRLKQDGYTLNQICQIRNLDEDSVLADLKKAAKNQLDDA